MNNYNNAKSQWLPSAEWEALFRRAGIEADKLDVTKSSRSKSTIIGKWLSRNVDRESLIKVGDRTGHAILRVRLGRSRKKEYTFEICWDECDDDVDPCEVEDAVPTATLETVVKRPANERDREPEDLGTNSAVPNHTKPPGDRMSVTSFKGKGSNSAKSSRPESTAEVPFAKRGNGLLW